MVVDDLGIIIGSVISGIAGGFLSSWMSFNASGEPFDARKHGNALITGALSGMGLGVLAAVANADKALDAAQVALTCFTIFLSAAGIDRFRSTGSKMVTRNKESGKLEVKESPPAAATTSTTTTTAPTTTSTTTPS